MREGGNYNFFLFIPLPFQVKGAGSHLGLMTRLLIYKTPSPALHGVLLEMQSFCQGATPGPFNPFLTALACDYLICGLLCSTAVEGLDAKETLLVKL